MVDPDSLDAFLELHPLPEEPVRPTHLYRHYNSDNELLYVGISVDAVSRLKRHSSEWKWTVARSEIAMFPTREEASAAEAEAIRAERPKYNVIYLPYGDRMEQYTMTSDQYRKAIAKLGMTQGGAAEFLGISVRSSNGYANGSPIPEAVSKLLRLMTQRSIRPEEVR
jgi:predicted GIY-YIG superfamily endonuclease